MSTSVTERPMHPQGEKVIMMHGLTGPEINLVVDILKKNFPEPGKLVFAATTHTSLEYQVGRWIDDLCEEKKQVQEMMRNYKKIQQEKENTEK